MAETPDSPSINGNDTQRFYVDGGFVQIEDNTVSVLTGASSLASEIDAAEAKKALEAANELPSENAALAEVKRKAVSQAQAKIRVAEKS